MKKRILAVGATAIVLAIAATGFRWATEWRFVETTDDAYVEGDITNMAPKVAALVVAVEAGDNVAVKAGDVLVRLDDTDYRARVAEARALVAARDAQVAQLDERVAVQEAVAHQAAAGIAAAKADVTRSRADLLRTERLVKDDYVSRQRFDAQTAEAAKADAGFKGSNAQLAAARRQLAVLEAERAVVRAQADQARALLAQAESDLAATVIRAPVDGVIGN
ncbi:MAG TPA: biotin/lipoyl-binding protein, partial [Candidatus Omnitrophota bacterium]|nr:biotin/lipoyl-binding protein [Candidatus Omnitrophota bacterium]